MHVERAISRRTRRARGRDIDADSARTDRERFCLDYSHKPRGKAHHADLNNGVRSARVINVGIRDSDRQRIAHGDRWWRSCNRTIRATDHIDLIRNRSAAIAAGVEAVGVEAVEHIARNDLERTTSNDRRAVGRGEAAGEDAGRSAGLGQDHRLRLFDRAARGGPAVDRDTNHLGATADIEVGVSQHNGDVATRPDRRGRECKRAGYAAELNRTIHCRHRVFVEIG